MAEPILIDGSEGEGGGQMLRSALTLSLLTGQPFRLYNVRANRPKPGLAAQHLASVDAAAQVGQATVRGNQLGSREVLFTPGAVRAGDYDIRISTAGATALVLHTVYLPLLLRGDGPSTLRIRGGTHVKAAPCFDYLKHTWAGYLEQLGGVIDLRLERPGFFPTGGGALQARITPVRSLNAFTPPELPPPPPPIIRAVSFAQGDGKTSRNPVRIAREQAEGFSAVLACNGLQTQVDERHDVGQQVGTYVGGLLPTSPVPTFHFSLGERGLRARLVGEAAARHLLEHWQTAPRAVDAHAADQLLLPLAWAQGASRFPVAAVTQHLLTNAAVIARFIQRPIRIRGTLGEPGWVEVAA